MKKIFIISSIVILFISCSVNTGQKNVSHSNETLETILNRTSIREYTNDEISQEELEDLLRAGMSAPSSRDRRPWQFIVISDKELLSRLGEKLTNASILKNTDKAIIVCGDTLISDNCWYLDCAAATQNILIAAASMDIGAVWTAVYPYAEREQIVNEVLELPQHIRALAIVPLGYPAKENTPKEKFDKSRIHYNGFN